MEIQFEYNKTIVDFDFLKESYKNGRLKGANVLAKLLNIDDNSSFKKEFNPNLFVDFKIKMKYWNYFIIFLRTGIMPCNCDYDMNYLMEEITKIGGAPILDEYYIKYYNNKLKNRKKYNPQKPEEDCRQLYDWVIQKDTNFKFFQQSELGKEYQACKIFRIVSSSVTEYVYFRKVKDGVDLTNEFIDNFSNEQQDFNTEANDASTNLSDEQQEVTNQNNVIAENNDSEREEISEWEQPSINQVLSSFHTHYQNEQ